MILMEKYKIPITLKVPLNFLSMGLFFWIGQCGIALINYGRI